MNWFTGKGRGKLRVKWKYTSVSQLWRILPSETGALIIEERDPSAKTVSFASLDADTGRSNWGSVRFDEGWWVTLDMIHRDLVFLHGYSAPDIPEHKGIIAVDLSTGARLWANPELKLLMTRDTEVYAAKEGFDGREFFELDSRSGAVLRTVDQSSMNVLRSIPAGTDPPLARFPEPVSSLGGWSSLPTVLTTALAPTLERDRAEVLEHPRYWIVGQTDELPGEEGRRQYRQRISIVGRESGEVVYAAVTANHAVASVPDLFFMFHGHLLCLGERSSLSAIQLDLP